MTNLEIMLVFLLISAALFLWLGGKDVKNYKKKWEDEKAARIAAQKTIVNLKGQITKLKKQLEECQNASS